MRAREGKGGQRKDCRRRNEDSLSEEDDHHELAMSAHSTSDRGPVAECGGKLGE